MAVRVDAVYGHISNTTCVITKFDGHYDLSVINQVFSHEVSRC